VKGERLTHLVLGQDLYQYLASAHGHVVGDLCAALRF